MILGKDAKRALRVIQQEIAAKDQPTQIFTPRIPKLKLRHLKEIDRINADPDFLGGKEDIAEIMETHANVDLRIKVCAATISNA